MLKEKYNFAKNLKVMKQIFLYVAALTFVLCSCGSPQSASLDDAFGLDELLVVADKNLNDTVTVIGSVIHTCKHSGMKCFIVGESQKISLRVEAGDEIGGFTPDLEGSRLAITGILREQINMSRASIDEQETEVKELQHHEGMEESCAAQLNNIAQMRAWMEEHNKDYYAVYYMDGLKYDLLD